MIGRENDSPFSWPGPLSLFLAVWCIYLLDRLFDAFRTEDPGDLPRRHRFARRNWRGLAALALFSPAIWLAFFAPKLPPQTLLIGSGLATLTAIYFVAFRFKRRISRFPAKETVIGVCFAVGVLAAAGTAEATAATLLCGLVLAALFTANCLVISLAERGYDSVADSAAHFAHRPPSSKLPFALLTGAIVGAILLLSFPAFQKVAVSAIAGAVLTFFVTHRSRNSPDTAQPLADAVLLVPWLVLGFDLTGLGH